VVPSWTKKLQSVPYAQGEGRVMIEANKPQLTLLERDEYYEVEKAKGKPFWIDVVSATSAEYTLVTVFHIGFDDGGEVGSGQGHVGRIVVHLTVHKVGTIDVHLQVVVVELEWNTKGT
jgi:hypothetical protein